MTPSDPVLPALICPLVLWLSHPVRHRPPPPLFGSRGGADHELGDFTEVSCCL